MLPSIGLLYWIGKGTDYTTRCCSPSTTSADVGAAAGAAARGPAQPSSPRARCRAVSTWLGSAATASTCGTSRSSWRSTSVARARHCPRPAATGGGCPPILVTTLVFATASYRAGRATRHGVRPHPRRAVLARPAVVPRHRSRSPHRDEADPVQAFAPPHALPTPPRPYDGDELVSLLTDAGPLWIPAVGRRDASLPGGARAPGSRRRARCSREFFRPGLRFLDVGANVGYFSLLVAQNCPGAVIHSFEPHPLTSRVLELNAWASGADITVARHGPLRRRPAAHAQHRRVQPRRHAHPGPGTGAPCCRPPRRSTRCCPTPSSTWSRSTCRGSSPRRSSGMAGMLAPQPRRRRRRRVHAGRPARARPRPRRRAEELPRARPEDPHPGRGRPRRHHPGRDPADLRHRRRGRPGQPRADPPAEPAGPVSAGRPASPPRLPDPGRGSATW